MSAAALQLRSGVARAVGGKLSRSTTAFFLCDIQERFRDVIQHFPSVVHVGSQMARAAKILDVPLIVTEQYSKAMGKTVAEIDVRCVAMLFHAVTKRLCKSATGV